MTRDHADSAAEKLHQGIPPGEAALKVLQPFQDMQDTDAVTGFGSEAKQNANQDAANQGGEQLPVGCQGFVVFRFDTGIKQGLGPLDQQPQGNNGQAGSGGNGNGRGGNGRGGNGRGASSGA